MGSLRRSSSRRFPRVEYLGHMSAPLVDLRVVRAPEHGAAVKAAITDLPDGATLLVVSGADPAAALAECDVEFAGRLGWEYRRRGPDVWQVEVTTMSSTEKPQLLHDPAASPAIPPAKPGQLARLGAPERAVEASVIDLVPGQVLGPHYGPPVDVVVHVVGGDGELVCGDARIALAVGVVAWLPRKALRTITAGPGGVRYVSVHARRLGPIRG